MKYIMVILIATLSCVFLLSCYKNIIIPATKDASLSSLLPDKNINGKEESIKGEGFGIKKKTEHEYITYPIMYLGSSDDYDIKEAFVVGGFDLSKLNGKIIHASLKFFVNYSSKSLKRVAIFIRPLKKEWSENKITYLDIYKDSNMDSKLTSIVESNEDKCMLIVFNIKANQEESLDKIPFSNSYRMVSIDVTKFIKEWVKNPDSNHGFLIDPLWMDDPRYCTTDLNNKISDFGIIEIATSEWFYWDGMVPSKFYLEEGRWIKVKNKAKKQLKYIPRLEVIIGE